MQRRTQNEPEQEVEQVTQRRTPSLRALDCTAKPRTFRLSIHRRSFVRNSHTTRTVLDFLCGVTYLAVRYLVTLVFVEAQRPQRCRRYQEPTIGRRRYWTLQTQEDRLLKSNLK
jgi:hypothetical protein